MKTLANELKTRKLVLFVILAIFSGLTFMATTSADAGVYDKGMHITYARAEKVLTTSDSVILDAFGDMGIMPTLLSPVVLNADPSMYDDFITDLQELGPDTKIFFGIGKNTWDLSDSYYWDKMMDRAEQYIVYSDCLRIDHFNSIVELSGESVVSDALDELHEMGFEHIMVNPWKSPTTAWPHVDGTWIAVYHDTTWLPKQDRMETINGSWPEVHIVNMYENASAHLALAAMTVSEQIEKFDLLLDDMVTNEISYSVAFPWTPSYDPLLEGTLEWMDDNYYSKWFIYSEATDDTFVTESNPTTNKGSNTNLRVRTDNDNDRCTFLKFDVSETTGTVTGSTLWVYSEDVHVSVDAKEVSSNSWSESTLVWNNMPAIGDVIDTTVCANATWCGWDVTDSVTGAGTYSFALVSSDDENDDFVSKEGGYTPLLIVEQIVGPGQASAPSPSTGATKVENPILSWTAGTGATSHDVYFGVTSGSPVFQGNQAGTTFNPGNLSAKTTYYWRIDEVNNDGTTYGVEWTFTTK